jgi:flagellar basal-body rod protein FlgF
MDSGLYAAYTGLLARTQALDTAANNLANAGTNGFRAHRDTFRSVLSSGLQPGHQGSQVGDSVNGFGVMGGGAVDLGQGPTVSTSNPLDLALNGSGFFAIRTAQGIRYTRDGSFVRSPAGQIETQRGEPVLDAQMQPIALPSGPVAVSADGTVSVATAVVGKVAVFNLPASSLKEEGTNRFSVAGGVTPALGDAEVKQGAIEGSNQDAIHGTMQLILVQRQAEMLQKALSVFHNDFDKTAVDEIARV